MERRISDEVEFKELPYKDMDQHNNGRINSSHSKRSHGKRPKWFTPRMAVFFFSFVNFLNYVDRGIIAGAGTTIKGCVPSIEHCSSGPKVQACPGHNTTDLQCDTRCLVCGTVCIDSAGHNTTITQTGFGINTQQLAYLQSAFLIGYMLACLTCAHLVHKIRPFRMIAVSLTCWTIAVVLSGLPNILCNPPGDSAHNETDLDLFDGAEDEKLCDYFYLTLVGRILSGIGEAAIGTTAVPYLDDRVASNKKGLYLALYFMTLPFGTAIGFVWGGFITSATANRWEWAFFLEAPLMVPFAIMALWIPDRLKSSMAETSTSVSDNNYEDDADDALLIPGGDDISPDKTPDEAMPTLGMEICGCLTQPIYMLTCLGYAAYSAVVAGLAFYGPLYIQTNRPCDERWRYSQSDADFVFGAIIASTGFFGTATGGWILDRAASKLEGSEMATRGERVRQAAWAILWQAVIGSGVLMGAAFFESPVLFFAALGVGCFFIFMCTAGINLVIAWSVPTQFRTMGMALSIVMLHGLGDVPSPIVIGYLADHTTPLITLVGSLTWLSWTLLLWGLGFLLARRKAKQL